MKIMIGNPVPKRFKRKDSGMPISNWFASSPRIALLTSECSMADSRSQYHKDKQGVVGPVRRLEVELLVGVAPTSEEQVGQERIEDEVVEHPHYSLGRGEWVLGAVERPVHVEAYGVIPYGSTEQEAPELDQDAIAYQRRRLRECHRLLWGAGRHIGYSPPGPGNQVSYPYEDQSDAEVGPAVNHLPSQQDALERRPFAERQLALPDDQEDGDRCEHPEPRYNLHAPEEKEACPRWSRASPSEVLLLRRHPPLPPSSAALWGQRPRPFRSPDRVCSSVLGERG